MSEPAPDAGMAAPAHAAAASPGPATIPASSTAVRYLARAGMPERERATVLGVWRGNLGEDARMPRKYDWFYLHAPAGMPLLHMLERQPAQLPAQDGLPARDAAAVVGVGAGVGAIGQRRMLYRGQPLQAGVLVDLAVLPDHRSLGPALILQQGLFTAARERLGVFYGFPNPKAAPVFKRIGYRALGDLVRHVRVVRASPYLRRRLPKALAPLAALAGPALDLALRLRDAWRWRGAGRLRASWNTRQPDITRLWEASEKPDALTALREMRHLRWRFDEAPDTNFRHLLLSADGEVHAWFATRSDGHTLHIHDFWLRGRGASADPATLTALLAAAHQDGHAAVSVELATSEERLAGWKALGFEPRGQRPIFGYVAPALAPADMPLDLHLTAADEDE